MLVYFVSSVIFISGATVKPSLQPTLSPTLAPTITVTSYPTLTSYSTVYVNATLTFKPVGTSFLDASTGASVCTLLVGKVCSSAIGISTSYCSCSRNINTFTSYAKTKPSSYQKYLTFWKKQPVESDIIEEEERSNIHSLATYIFTTKVSLTLPMADFPQYQNQADTFNTLKIQSSINTYFGNTTNTNAIVKSLKSLNVLSFGSTRYSSLSMNSQIVSSYSSTDSSSTSDYWGLSIVIWIIIAVIVGSLIVCCVLLMCCYVYYGDKYTDMYAYGGGGGYHPTPSPAISSGPVVTTVVSMDTPTMHDAEGGEIVTAYVEEEQANALAEPHLHPHLHHHQMGYEGEYANPGQMMQGGPVGGYEEDDYDDEGDEFDAQSGYSGYPGGPQGPQGRAYPRSMHSMHSMQYMNQPVPAPAPAPVPMGGSFYYYTGPPVPQQQPAPQMYTSMYYPAPAPIPQQPQQMQYPTYVSDNASVSTTGGYSTANNGMYYPPPPAHNTSYYYPNTTPNMQYPPNPQYALPPTGTEMMMMNDDRNNNNNNMMNNNEMHISQYYSPEQRF